MKEKISLLANGIFTYDVPSIVEFDDKIHKSVIVGSVQKGSFTIKNSIGSKMKGILYSSNSNFHIRTKTFVGVENVIEYEIDGRDLTIQDTVKGIITIVTDCKELQVPYHIQVEAPYFETSIGRVKDLMSFTNLAKVAELEAVKLFISPQFETFIIPYDTRQRLLYQELVKSKNAHHGMEEFLVSIQKKLPIQIEVDKKSIYHTVQPQSFKDSLVITKDQWGYGEYKVVTEDEFIELEIDTIKTSQFLNHTYTVEYFIHPNYMHPGKNYGSIRIVGSKQDISIEVICQKEKKEDNSNYYDRILRPYQLKVTRNYVNFRKNTVTNSEYAEVGMELIHSLTKELQLSYLDHLKYSLLRIHFDIVDGRVADAKESLERIKHEVMQLKDKRVHMYCAYEYLQALAKKDENTIFRSIEIINRLYEENPKNFNIVCFLFYMDKRYDNNYGQRLLKLKEHYSFGTNSPILYYEAMAIYNDEPALFLELGSFEIAVLTWAMKEDIISEEVGQKLAYFARKRKVYNGKLMRLLFYVYEMYREEDILITICSLLIRNHQMNPKYHMWFDLGVHANLRITELYEYYMYTFSDKKDILLGELVLPKQVLLYFSYNSNLSDKKKAYLYAYVIINKEHLMDVFSAYEERIFDFAKKNILLHNMNYHLSIIYQYYLKNDEIEEDVKQELVYVMFRYQLQCNHPDMKGVYVVFDELNDNKYVNIVGGMAQLEIYNSRYQLFLVDEKDNYYKTTTIYTLDQLFPWEEYIHLYHRSEVPSPIVLSNLYHSDSRMAMEQIQIREYLMGENYIREEERMKNILTFIDYFYHNFDGRLLDNYLYEIRLEQIPSNKRAFIIELWILRGMYDLAIQGIKIYGMEGIDFTKLMKLCAELLEDTNSSANSNQVMNNTIVAYQTGNATMYEEKLVTRLAYYIFKSGKYTVPILEHLVKHYNGSTSDLFYLWECAVGFELKTTWIEERLLGQMLFSQSFIRNSFSVFERYYTHGSNYELIKAYLSYQSFYYLMEDRMISEELYQIMRKEMAYEENEICILALLKYNSKQEFLDARELQFVDYHISKYIGQGIILPFFKDYSNHIELPSRIMDKVFFSYATNPKNRVYMRYRFQNKLEMEEKQVEMKLMYLGIFVYPLVLFDGEQIEYTIIEEHNNEIRKESEQYSYHKEESFEIVNERYSLLNHLDAMLMQKDDNGFMKEVEILAREKSLIEAVFKPII